MTATKDEIEELIRNSSNGVITPKNYFVQVPNSFIRNKDLTISEKIVYIYLWGFGGDKYNAYPGMKRMQEELSISKKTLITILKSLENKDGIYIINRIYKDNNKKKGTNLYYLSEINNLDGTFIKGYLDIVKKLYPDKRCIIN